MRAGRWVLSNPRFGTLLRDQGARARADFDGQRAEALASEHRIVVRPKSSV